MSHRDTACRNGLAPEAQDLVTVIDWLLAAVDFNACAPPKDGRWTFRGLVIVAILWVWSDETTLTGRFAAVRDVAGRLWPHDVATPISYQAFLKRLVRWTESLICPLKQALRAALRRTLHTHWQIAGRCVFGVDGSKLELPRTRSNEGRFSPAAVRQGRPTRRSRRSSHQTHRSRRKKADSPQLWITTLWHAGTGLPWEWRLGAADSSERNHLLEMANSLPPHSLITADAGFVGYHVWATLLAGGHDLLIRVGGNVRLLKQLGFAREASGTVYLWPDQVARRHQPPLVLRLVVVQGPRHPWYLVTSVQRTRELSNAQVAEIYRRRWGIEVFYRHFKQTFGRRKLRSHVAEHVICEAHWSLIGLWSMLLYAAQHLHRHQFSPHRLSVAAMFRAFRRLLKLEVLRPQADHFHATLTIALLDSYQRRNKASRNYPRKKYESPCGPPAIHTATLQQQTLARNIRQGLTA